MKKLVTLALLSLSTFTFGQDGALIENVEFNGNGCLPHEAIAVMSPDQQTLSLLFDNYTVEVGGDNHARRDYKECQVKLDLLVPQDTRVVFETIDYRGFSLLPVGGRMNFSSNYQIKVPNNQIESRVFTKKDHKIGAIEEDFFVEHFVENKVLKSNCGEDFTLEIESELMGMSNGSHEEVFIALDSLDTGMNFKISYEPCRSQVRRTNREELSRNNRVNRAMRRQISEHQRRQLRHERQMRRGGQVHRPVLRPVSRPVSRRATCRARDCQVSSSRNANPRSTHVRNTRPGRNETRSTRNDRLRDEREARHRSSR